LILILRILMPSVSSRGEPFLLTASKIQRHWIEMPTIGDLLDLSETAIVGIFAVLAVVVVVVIYLASAASSGPVCPKEIHRKRDGSLVLHPTGQVFKDMNDFQQYFNSSGLIRSCAMPRLTGAREVDVLINPDRPMQGPEETYAKTPINKVDDYEFSRIFGIERGNEMVIPRQNFNKIISDRAFDKVNMPVSADARKDSYRGLVEGFTAAGDLTSDASESYGSSDSSHEAAARYSETSSVGYSEPAARFGEVIEDEPDKDCKISREEKKIARLVAKAYENDPNFDPVVVRTGPNNWEVTELIPKRRGAEREVIVEEQILDPKREAVDIKFRYPSEEGRGRRDMIDPFFPPEGDRGNGWERHRDDHDRGDHRAERDPYYGYVPGLERPFGPTLDHFSWT
jgi:hypothetical protein